MTVVQSSALASSTSSSSTASSLSSSSNSSKPGKSGVKMPFVRRVPPPRVSLDDTDGSLSTSTSVNIDQGLSTSASMASLAPNRPLVNQGALEAMSQISGAGPSYTGDQAAQAVLFATPNASHHLLSVAPPTVAMTSAATRSPVMARTASGGAKIAALASRFGSSAVQKVAAAKQQVQMSASAALSSAASSSRSASPGNSVSANESNNGGFKTIAGGLKGKGTSLVAGAAAKVRSTGVKGKERFLAAAELAGTDSSGPSPRLSPNMQQSTSFRGLGRRPSISSTVVLGVSIPANRAGEVFGAPLRVAADRTRLEKVADLPINLAISHAAASRRREACRHLPAIAIRCLDYLNEYGKTEEGLYRIPGSSQQVANLRTIFDSGSDVDLVSKLSTQDLEPSAVASVFKLWLRELPDSLLHQLERDVDLLLMEHTGNAASSKVTMAQTQSTGVAANPSSNTSSHPSPLVVERIRTLFAESLPIESLVLLREISYHLAHLSEYASVTRMTFANLRLILSPTLRLSPVMLSILVNERESVFPKPGHLGHARNGTAASGLSIDFQSSQPQLKLSLPGIDDLALPPLPEKPAQLAGVRAPYSSVESSWSTTSIGSGGLATGKRSTGSLHSYRASWHVVDLPPPRTSETDDDEAAQTIGTPIARKFIHQRTASAAAAKLIERSASASPPSSGSAKATGTSPLQRTPTFSGFGGRSSPSPFFSSGASPGVLSGHARKRSSMSSIGSLRSSNPDATAEWRTRRVSSIRTQAATITTVAAAKSVLQDEEEELSSSDTNTSLSSVDSAATPKDQHDIRVEKSDPAETDDFASRRRTVTAESFGRDEIKRKRGSMMLMNLPAELLGQWKDEKAIMSTDAMPYTRTS